MLASDDQTLAKIWVRLRYTCRLNIVWRMSRVMTRVTRAAKNSDFSFNFIRIRAPFATLAMMIARVAFQIAKTTTYNRLESVSYAYPIFGIDGSVNVRLWTITPLPANGKNGDKPYILQRFNRPLGFAMARIPQWNQHREGILAFWPCRMTLSADTGIGPKSRTLNHLGYAWRQRPLAFARDR
jgi:hypothetical protein